MSTHRNRTLRRIKQRLEWYRNTNTNQGWEDCKSMPADAWYYSVERRRYNNVADILYKFRI